MRLSLLAVCVLASTASAQPNPNQAEADRFFAEGRDLLVNKQDAKGACEQFEKAIALDPLAPGVMLNLGLCYEMQEKYATSLYWFRKAQFAAAEAKPPLPEYEAEAKQHTGTLVDKVVLARVDVSQAPAGVRISVDGRPVRPEDYRRLEVDKDSTIEARAPGKQVFRQQVEVDGRHARDIVIVMQDDTPTLRDPGASRRRLAYIVGASGVVVWGLSLTYGLIVRSRYEDVSDGHYDGAGGFERAERDLRYKGTGLFLLGSAAVGAGIWIYLTAPKPYRERAQQATITPIVTPDQIGFGYARAF